MRLTRTLSSRYPGLFQFAVIAFWVSSIYLTYFYSSNSVAYHPLQAFPNNYNHKNRGAKSFYEYNYHEKVILATGIIFIFSGISNQLGYDVGILQLALYFCSCYVFK